MKTREIVSRNEFNNVIRGGVTLIDFKASWCEPCRLQEPILDEIADRFEGKARVAAINIDDHQELAKTFRIKGIPTLVLFKNSREVKRFIGLHPETTLSEALDQMVA